LRVRVSRAASRAKQLGSQPARQTIGVSKRAVRPRLLRPRAGSAGIQHRRTPPLECVCAVSCLKLHMVVSLWVLLLRVVVIYSGFPVSPRVLLLRVVGIHLGFSVLPRLLFLRVVGVCSVIFRHFSGQYFLLLKVICKKILLHRHKDQANLAGLAQEYDAARSTAVALRL
jgi:hypothetical protein